VERTIKTKLTTSGREPLVAALHQARVEGFSTFAQAEDLYLKAMTEFDALVADGTATQGDIQNGKGDFFNDFLVVLLEKASDKELSSRPNIPGLSFKRHNLDVAYPAAGAVFFTIETKATGIPKHPRNTRQKHADGRAGSADLPKRLKEAIFKNIDLKAEAARVEGKGGGPTSDLQNWLRTTPPRTYLFLSVRARDESDLRESIKYGEIGRTWFDDCGLYCYGWNDSRTTYESKPVPTTIELDRTLATVSTALRALP
jgi:hypothetical protein